MINPKKQTKNMYWGPGKINKTTPQPKLKLPEVKMKDVKGLVKTGVGIAVAGAALGLGLKAFNEAQE